MKPILFNTDMVKAILEERKKVTRRIANISTETSCNDGTTNHEFVLDDFGKRNPTGFVCRKCGFGVAPPNSRVPCGHSLFRPRYWPGDILYVRETWTQLFYVDPSGYTHWDQPMYYYAADGTPDTVLVDGDGFEEDDQRIRWKPSIHMPKKLARIFIRVTHIRLERLQEITADECPMEGVWPLFAGLVGEREVFYKGAFAKLWDSTIKPFYMSRYGWDANPWVWVIRFERCEKPKEA